MPNDLPDWITAPVAAINKILSGLYVAPTQPIGASQTLRLRCTPNPATADWNMHFWWGVSQADPTVLEGFAIGSVSETVFPEAGFDIPVRGGLLIPGPINPMYNGQMSVTVMPFFTDRIYVLDDGVGIRRMNYSGALTSGVGVIVPAGDGYSNAMAHNGRVRMTISTNTTGDLYMRYIGISGSPLFMHLATVTAGVQLEIDPVFPPTRVNLLFIPAANNAAGICQVYSSAEMVY